MIFFLFHFFFIENSASSTVRPIKRVTRLKCTGNYVRDEEMKDETRQIHNLRKKKTINFVRARMISYFYPFIKY